MKIRILTQNPLSVGFGGVELQASKYIQNIKVLDSEIDIDYFKWDEEDFDILHIIGIHTGINPYWIDVLKSKGIKIIVSSVFYIKANSLFDFRRPIIYKILSFFPFHIVNRMKLVLEKSDIILPNSEEEKKQIISIFGIKSDKITVLYNGVDKNYYDGVNKKYFSEKYNITNYILSVSHIEPRKNHLSLIKGFLRFHKNNISDLKLVLFGDYRGNYFDYHNEVKEIINKNTNKIIHIKDLNNSNVLFKSAYLGSKAHFLLSSLETPGLSNIEAALVGNKLVLGSCKPVKEYFKDYADYIDGKNISDIEKTIKYIETTCLYNQEQVKFIQENYTWENISEKLFKIYKKIGSKK